MEDLLWIAIMVGLLAATLAYARLCDATDSGQEVRR
jgi:hypothetical protein